MKPISATKANSCDHCETTQVKNLTGKEETRYICDLQTDNKETYKNKCTVYDWIKCEKNEDK